MVVLTGVAVRQSVEKNQIISVEQMRKQVFDSAGSQLTLIGLFTAEHPLP